MQSDANTTRLKVKNPVLEGFHRGVAIVRILVLLRVIESEYSDSLTFNRANSSITVITLDRAISHDSACYHSKEDFSLYIIMCSPFQESEDLRLIHIWAWNSLSDHMRHMFRPFFVNGRTRVTWLY